MYKGLIWLTVCWSALSIAQGQTSVEVSDELREIRADEPVLTEFSPEKAARYLDEASLTWQKRKKCATCHTNLPYLMARPALASVLADSGDVRSFFEDYRKVRWKDKSPSKGQGFWPVVVATGLTFNDLQTSGHLSEITRDVLDFVWASQREDGGWRWPDCDYAPMEIDEHFGVTLVALTVGLAPDGYAETPAAKAGLGKLRRYLKNDPPKSLHHRAMLAWSSVRVDGIATEAERQATLTELMGRQLPDGGWSTSGLLSDWKGLLAEDDPPLETDVSDGYGTGLVIVIARELGIPASDPRLQKGIGWIKSHQRENGMWFTRSPVVDAGNLISNTGTAYVILALQACGELPGSPLGK